MATTHESNGIDYEVFTDLHTHKALVEQAGELIERIDSYDPVPAFSEVFVLGISQNRGHSHILARREGTLVGLLAIDSDRVVELGVDPEFRNRGIARKLITHLRESLQITGVVSVWAHGDLPEAERFVIRLDARRSRELHKMMVACTVGSPQRATYDKHHRLALERLDSCEVEILNYTQACEKFGQDYVDEQWLRVNNEAFAWHPEQGGWSREQLSTARKTSWFNPQGALMAWKGISTSDDSDDSGDASGDSSESAESSIASTTDTDTASANTTANTATSVTANTDNFTTGTVPRTARCVGFHWTKKLPESTVGEVYVVCVADEVRGLGLGVALTALGIGFLLAEGCEDLELYVEGDNAPAIATYRRLGFEVVHTDVMYRGHL